MAAHTRSYPFAPGGLSLRSAGQRLSLSLWLWLVTCLTLAACGTSPTPPPDRDKLLLLLAEAAAPQPLAPEGADDWLAMSPAMERFLEETLAPQIKRVGPLRALHQALFQPGQLQIDYDASFTRTAAQAFETRSGNCLSLVLMSAALARHLGLSVDFRWVHGASQWQRDPQLLLHNGHVSLILSPRVDSRRQGYDAAGGLEVDFLPPPPQAGAHRSSRLSESQVRALFMNNRAAEHLRDGALDDAYRWARAAVLAQPEQPEALNTLAVVHRRRGQPLAAEAVWRHLLSAVPDHASSLANLASLLRSQGRDAESQALLRRLAAAEAAPPFHALHQGVAAYQRGQHLEALRWMQRELADNGGSHELHFWLAQVHWALGDAEAAAQAMAEARTMGPTPGLRDRYNAKLAWLQAHSRP